MTRRLLAALGLAAAVFVIYRAAIPAYFFEDDFQWLVTRWSFQPSDLLDIGSRSHFYRPIVELYFWIASPLFNGSPVAFHLFNIALHVANGGLVYLISSELGLRRGFAWVAALFFVVQPGHVAAIAWVGALAEAIGMLAGCTSIHALLRFRRSGAIGWQALSVAALGFALLTHESSVVFMPLLVLADWTSGRWSWRWRDLIKVYAPFALVMTAYLLVDLTINSKHYLISEGQYRLGLHMIRNVFEYIASLYVGERTIWVHLTVAAVLAAILWRGSPRARFAVLWMIIAMAPFLPLTFGNVSRYLYLPAAGLAMLFAEGLSSLDAWLVTRTSATARQAAVIVIVLFVAVRFGNFAQRGVRDLATRAEMYRTFLTDLRRQHPQLTDGAVLPVSAKIEKDMPLRFLEAAVQWEYRNPTIRLTIVEKP